VSQDGEQSREFALARHGIRISLSIANHKPLQFRQVSASGILCRVYLRVADRAHKIDVLQRRTRTASVPDIATHMDISFERIYRYILTESSFGDHETQWAMKKCDSIKHLRLTRGVINTQDREKWLSRDNLEISFFNESQPQWRFVPFSSSKGGDMVSRRNGLQQRDAHWYARNICELREIESVAKAAIIR